MRVLKFGGSSVATAEGLCRVARVVRQSREQEPVAVVVSALGGVTDDLVALTRLAVEDRWQAGYQAMSQRHYDTLRQLSAERGHRASRALARRLDVLLNLLQMVAEQGSCPPPLRARILASGERLSVLLTTVALEREGLEVRAVDGTSLIATDSVFDGAWVDSARTRKQCRRLLPWLAQNRQGPVALVSGFLGADRDGRTTLLGRDGSDYSATLLGDALDARRVEIWTDVDGVLSADPRQVAEPRLLDRLGYGQAAELATLGARLLHPRSLAPAAPSPSRPEGIPVLVRNTERPQREGTEITPLPASQRGKRPVLALTAIPEVQRLWVPAHEVRCVARHLASSRQPALYARAENAGLELWLAKKVGLQVLAVAGSADAPVQETEPAEHTPTLGNQVAQLRAHQGLGMIALLLSRPSAWAQARQLSERGLARLGLEPQLAVASPSGRSLLLLLEAEAVPRALASLHQQLILDPEQRLAGVA